MLLQKFSTVGRALTPLCHPIQPGPLSPSFLAQKGPAPGYTMQVLYITILQHLLTMDYLNDCF